jgi:hypothetical protein
MDDRVVRLEPYSPTAYAALDIDRLVVFAAVELQRLGIPLSLENLIVASYKLFPEKFSLDGYSEYPDATRIEKSLWRCRGEKKWLEGKTRHGYMVSDRSELIAGQVQNTLGRIVVGPHRQASRLRRHESILRDAKSSVAYTKYEEGSAETISRGVTCCRERWTLLQIRSEPILSHSAAWPGRQGKRA